LPLGDVFQIAGALSGGSNLVILRITRVNGNTAVAEVGGDLCGYFARKASELFDSCVRNGIRSFVLDMQNCFSIDSLGVELLMNLSFMELRLVNMGWSMGETCRAEGFNLHEVEVDGFNSVEDALKSLDAKVTTHEQLALCDFTVHNLRNYRASEEVSAGDKAANVPATVLTGGSARRE
jgi:anti-anti-sigma regulatory factor